MKTGDDSVYYLSWKTLLIDTQLVDAILISLSVVLLKVYCHELLFLLLIFLVFVKNLVCTAFFFLYFEEIYIVLEHSIFKREETCFRVHQRQFVEEYQRGVCDREIEWKDSSCLLCEKQAVVVYFSCGHLALCFECN